jgi:hypothetical protein|tara:strand:- start:2291 stop:2392 length:102 start_codon:yes stop_codon:yes gene_type:complete
MKDRIVMGNSFLNPKSVDNDFLEEDDVGIDEIE